MKIKYFGAFIALFFLPFLAHAAQDTQGVFKSLDQHIQIEKTGILHVKDTVTYNFDGGKYYFANRSFVTRFGNSREEDRYVVENVAVTTSAGRNVSFSTSTEGFYYSIDIGSGDEVLKGTQTYTLTYDVLHVLDGFSKDSYFYWNSDFASLNGSDGPVRVTVMYPAFEAGIKIEPYCSVSSEDLLRYTSCESSVSNGALQYTQASVPSGGYMDVSFGFGTAFAGDEEEISSFDEVVHVHTDGTARVEEKIVYNFGSNAKHGIYRTIPTSFKTKLGTLRTRISNVLVADEHGVSYPFTASGFGTLNIKIGDPQTEVTGIKTYVISYDIGRVINFFGDHDELYWNVTGNEWTVPIKHSSAQIILPRAVAQGSVSVECFVGQFGSTVSCDKKETVPNGANFDHGMLSYAQGLTVVVGFPKGVVIPPTSFQKAVEMARDNWIVVIPVIVFFLFYFLWRSRGRDPYSNDPIVAQYEAPLGLSPSEVYALWKLNRSSQAVTAEIIELAVQGFLKINFIDDDYEFVRVQTDKKPQKELQQTILDGIFLNADKSKGVQSVKLSSLKNKFYLTNAEVVLDTMQSLIFQKLLPKDPILVKLPYIFGAVIIAFVGFFASGFFGLIGFLSLIVTSLIIVGFGNAMPKRTLLGAQVLKQILGLKLYLEVAEKDRINFHNAPEKNPAQFEKLLPYAIVFGVEKEWAKQFEGIYVTPPSWYDGNMSQFNTIVFVNSLNDFNSTTKSVFTSSPSSAGSGGSGFSGGGSGGGFGGGGGGSW